jgi:hypothetical protein
MAKKQSIKNVAANDIASDAGTVTLDTGVIDTAPADGAAASIGQQIANAAKVAMTDGDHAAYAALDDLDQLLHALKTKARAAIANLDGSNADLAAKLLEL